jgi:hypothetical protein
MYTLLYCHDSHTMWNRCTHYCTVTTHTLCETVVTSCVRRDWVRFCTMVKVHDGFIFCVRRDSAIFSTTVSHSVWVVTVQYSDLVTFTIVQNLTQSRRTQDVKPLFTIFYSHDPHKKWNRCVEYCTVTTQALCETDVHIIVLSRLTHAVSHLVCAVTE